MKKNIYTLDEAQVIGTQIIKQRSEELKKDLLQNTKNKDIKLKENSYV